MTPYPYGMPPSEIPMVFGQRMIDWSGTDDDWETFFDSLIEDLADQVWPKWVENIGWSGGATKFFEEATKAELNIQVAEIQKKNLLAEAPRFTKTASALLQRDHFWLFALEDDISIRLPEFVRAHYPRYKDPTPEEIDLAKFGLASIAYYDPALVDGRSFLAYQRMYTHKYEGLYQTKLVFRRPRPHQMAFGLNIEDFRHHQALWSVHTGNHPSLVSGHCIQGFLLACTLIEMALEGGVKVNDLPLASYRQFAADLGDRRVFAGVHYVTDNISSWITVLRVIPWIFHDWEIYVKFCVESIVKHSAVYRIASEYFPSDGDLSSSWQLLETEISKYDGL